MTNIQKNGVVYGVVLYGQGALGAQNGRKYGQKYTKCTTKTAKNRLKRIAKSLGWVTGAEVRILSTPPYEKDPGHQILLIARLFFYLWGDLWGSS